MIKLINIVNDAVFDQMERRSYPKWELREVWVNPSSVIKVETNPDFKKLLLAGLLPEGLDRTHEFARVTIQEGNSTSCYVVVGSAGHVASKLAWEPKSPSLLKG